MTAKSATKGKAKAAKKTPNARRRPCETCGVREVRSDKTKRCYLCRRLTGKYAGESAEWVRDRAAAIEAHAKAAACEMKRLGIASRE